MINKELIHPQSIVVVGGSNELQKPGGKVLHNLIRGGFAGKLYVVNPKETDVQGIACVSRPEDLPQVDMAIMAIAARHTLAAVTTLVRDKGTKAVIILSAGFSEENEEGKLLEKEVVSVIESAGATLIGPNCIGVVTPYHQGVFTEPLPVLDKHGCDFISGSGATACFILEAGIPKGLRFSSVFSVGNSAQIGVEEVLEYLDESFDPDHSSRVKLLYIETINKPAKLLRHAVSLIRKGCHIAAIKAGASEAGSRAASSHTGAIATPDFAVETLFRKAGIVRCYGREDLISVASVFMHKQLTGPNLAVITHAGGPAVMLTDALSTGGLSVPHITHPASKELLQHLFPGSSVANPIDFLATGTAEQLGTIIDYVERDFDEIDGMIVIFGTPGLSRIFDVYDVLDEKMRSCRKPIFPVLPSTLTAAEEVAAFVRKGHCYFPDEVVLGKALARTYFTQKNVKSDSIADMPAVDIPKIRQLINQRDNGYLAPEDVQHLLDAAGINRAKEYVARDKQQAFQAAQETGFPLVMKVVGPIHKSDSGGVVLNIKDMAGVEQHFANLMAIQDAEGVLLQPMLTGSEVFIGVKHEPGFGHLILCGLGGIFIEILHDFTSALSPVSRYEALDMISRLKGHKLFEGVRGRPGINEPLFAEAIIRVSALVQAAPEIIEMDINPLMGNPEQVVAVDARIRIEKH